MGGSNSTLSNDAAVAAAYKSCEAMKVLLTQVTLNADAIAATFSTVKPADRANVAVAICTEAWVRGDDVLFATYESIAFKRSVDDRSMTSGGKGIQVNYLNKLYQMHLLAILRECRIAQFADNLAQARSETVAQDLISGFIRTLQNAEDRVVDGKTKPAYSDPIALFPTNDALEKLEALSAHLSPEERAFMIAERAKIDAATTVSAAAAQPIAIEPVVAAAEAAAEAVSVAIVESAQAVDAVKVATEAVGALVQDLTQ